MSETEDAVLREERSPSPAFLSGGGEMGDRIRAYDWAASPIGPPATWSSPLRTVLRMMLTTNHPVFVFWGDALTCFYNDAYAASLGPEKHPAMLGMPGREAWDEIWPIIGPQIELVRAGGGSTWHDDHLVPITRYGRVEDVYWTYSYGPIHDDDAQNSIGGVLVLCRETTQRVLEVASVKADLDRYRLLFAQSPGFICVLRGPEHRFEYCNPAYFAMIGDRGDPIGQRVVDVLPEVAAQGFVELMDSVYHSGVPHSATAARVVLGGLEHFVDFVYQPLRSDHDVITGILVQGVDVTQRELAQRALRHSASRLQIATDAAWIGIHEYDVRENTIEWDTRVRQLWGVSESEEITYDLFMAGLVEEDRAPTQRAVDRALDPSSGGRYFVEYRVRDTSGVVRWVRATGQVEFDDAQKPVRLIGTVQDISDEKRAAADLIEADHRKDVFLATLAHELRNPLAPIRNAAQILGLPGVQPAQVAWAQQVIARQAAHMSALLDDLLDVARLTQGRMVLKRVPVEVRAVVDSALETVATQLRDKHHRLRQDVASHGLTVLADPVRLSQVFANLLANAIKYAEPGGDILVSARTAGASISVSVRDSGVGISADSLPRVFNMFEQTEESLVRAEGGLGIGLALVRAIVELHGGEVIAVSQGLGKGSEFTVTLPAAAEVLGVAARDATPDIPVRRTGKRILIADDNRDAAESLAMLLGMIGHDVRVAFDGQQTLEFAQQFVPDIVLMDIGMPKMNGYDVAAALRAGGDTGSMRLVALTGWGQADDRDRAFSAGFDAHLTKPPDLQLLLGEIAL